MMLSRAAAAAAALALGVVITGPAGGSASVANTEAGPALTPMLATVPDLPALRTTTRTAATECDLPDGSFVSYYHCYTPQDVRTAYGVDDIAPLSSGAANQGAGQTIVLVDSYGSPTAAADLQHFHDTFFPGLPDPSFEEIYPQGKPGYKNNCNVNTSSMDLSGPCAAAGWSGEATLDIEWAYAMAPKAHIVLLAANPAETLGTQGFPNLFKAISHEIDVAPAGTVFSMSFGVDEPTFGGAAKAQTAKFDEVFKKGIAKGDNFFASSGDDGTTGTAKQQGESATYDHPTVGWPASSPYVTAVGGTQLQYGWTWNPSSNTPRQADGSRDPGYYASTAGGDTQTVWNESWGPIATGGGASEVYSRPSWQTGVASSLGDHRIVPDLSWNAAVNGGVDVWISAYPEYNCGTTTGCWTFYGGTSAAAPQTAAIVALANAARADAGKAPLGFLNPMLYGGLGASSVFTDIVPVHEGTAPQAFAGAEVGVDGPVSKSVGDLIDNQAWGESSDVPGYPTTAGYDATTGWGAPKAAGFVAALAGQS